MARNDVLAQLIESGMSFTQMTQARAEEIVKDLTKSGDIRKKEAQRVTKQLVDRGRESTEKLLAMVQAEVAKQVGRFAAQLDEVESRLEELADQVRSHLPNAGRARGAKGDDLARCGPGDRWRRPGQEGRRQEGTGEEGRCEEDTGEEDTGEEGHGQEGAGEEDDGGHGHAPLERRRLHEPPSPADEEDGEARTGEEEVGSEEGAGQVGLGDDVAEQEGHDGNPPGGEEVGELTTWPHGAGSMSSWSVGGSRPAGGKRPS